MRHASSSDPVTCAGLVYFLAGAIFFSLRFILDVFVLTVLPSLHREAPMFVRWFASVLGAVILTAAEALLGASWWYRAAFFAAVSSSMVQSVSSVLMSRRFFLSGLALQIMDSLARKVAKRPLAITLPSGRMHIITKGELFEPLVAYATFLTSCTRGRERPTSSLARHLPAALRFGTLLLLGWSTHGAAVASQAPAKTLPPAPPLPSCRTY